LAPSPCALRLVAFQIAVVSFSETYISVAWLSWVPNLLIAEVIVNRIRPSGPRRQQPRLNLSARQRQQASIRRAHLVDNPIEHAKEPLERIATGERCKPDRRAGSDPVSPMLTPGTT